MSDDLDPFKPVYDRVERIRKLEAQGIVLEACPGPRYLRWDIVIEELLPEEFVSDLNAYGEIRQYW